MTEQKGYFLLETVILGAVMLAAASTVLVFSMASRLCVHNETAVAAAFLCQEQLAYIEAQDKTILASADSMTWQGKNSEQVELNGHKYMITTKITPYDDPGFCKAVVTICWDEKDRKVEQKYQKLVRVK